MATPNPLIDSKIRNLDDKSGLQPVPSDVAPPDFSDDPHLMDYVSLALRYKWQVVAILLAVPVLFVAATFILPQIFETEAMLLPPDRMSSRGLLSQFTSGYAIDMLKAIENPSVDLIQNLIESRALSERLARDSTIHSYLVAEGVSQSDMPEAVHESLTVIPGITKVEVQGKTATDWLPNKSQKERSRTMSAYLVNAAVTCMDSMMRGQIRSLAHLGYIYADSDYAIRNRELMGLDSQQQVFEDAHGIVELSAQTKARIESVGALLAVKDQAEIKLHLLQLDMQSQTVPVEAATAEISEAERTARTAEVEADAGPGFDSLPAVNRAYAEILRSKKALEPIVSFLRQETEQQRILEVREKSVISVIDTAQVPTVRKSPIRSQMGFLGLLAGIAVALLYVGIRSLVVSWRLETAARQQTAMQTTSATRVFSKYRHG